MEKYLMAIEALKAAREELIKSGTILSWELITVNKMTTAIDQVNNYTLGKLAESS